MAFWGIEVKPGKPITHSCEKARGRLRISQATLGTGNAIKKSILQCNVGKRTPILLCALLPNQTESCHLDLEFEEADDVMFSVIGPRSVFLSGYYISRSQHQNPQSDSESFGVDIQNSQTDGSSYRSDDDKYEDSFIDDNEVQVSSPSPDVSSNGMDETTPENDKLENKKGRGKRLKKKFQVVESDDENDAHSRESEDDDDGFLLSIFKNKRAAKSTSIDDRKKIAQETVGMGDKSDNGVCDRKSREKLDHTDKNGKLEREKELPVCNGENQMKSLDLEKQRKKRKERLEEKPCEIEIGKDHSIPREDKEHEVEALTNLDIGEPLEPGSGSCKKSKKKRKKLNLEETCTEVTVEESHNVGKDYTLDVDCTMKDLPAADEDKEQQIDNNAIIKSESLVNASQPEKKSKKKMKNKTLGEGDLNIGPPTIADNHENVSMKFDNQTENVNPIRNRTLSNGLTIEEVANGPPDGKVATPGKKVRVYYTAMLKENGHVFDSNVGKTACKFRLGDEGIIEGWNLGIDGMHVGDKRRLVIPPSMSVGKYGAGENVPPQSWLVYDVELVGVRK